MGRHAGDANGAEGQAGDAADSGAQQAAAPAAAGTATTPAGRRSRAKKTRPLAETYERQASLWRALYRFVCDAHDIVVGQASGCIRQLGCLGCSCGRGQEGSLAAGAAAVAGGRSMTCGLTVVQTKPDWLG